MKTRPKISAVINVRNEAEQLEICLKSIKDFADEIIIIDMMSSDGSREIAQKYTLNVFPYKPLKYVEPARNFGLSKATGKWILLLDPDEVITKTLKKELFDITNREDIDYVKIPRKNLIFGKWMRHSNSWPDYLIRFFKKGSVTWKKEIHSQPEVHGNGTTLLDSEKLAIKHNNYPTITSFILRAIRYSNVQADELKIQKYKLKISDFILKPVQEFNSRFFSAEGYKDGIHGLIFCILQAIAIAFVYIRLWEKQGSSDKSLSKESFVSASQEAIFEYGFWFKKYFLKEYGSNIFKNFFITFRQLLNRITKNY